MILKFRTIFTELILREIKAEINSKPVETVIFALVCIVFCVDGCEVTNIDSSLGAERQVCESLHSHGNF